MLLSNSCEYGLRAALYLAAHEEKGYISIKKISEDLELSRHFLTKILQQLTADDLLESYKGPNGGVRLAKPGEETSLLEIVEAIEGEELFDRCVLGLPGCGMKKPCPIHDEWLKHREGILEMLSNTSLSRLAEKSKDFKIRITAENSLLEL